MFHSRWFCHFDDDVYANVPNLVSALAKTGNETDDSVYFGSWPADMIKGRLKDGIRVRLLLTTSCYFFASDCPGLSYILYPIITSSDYGHLYVFWTVLGNPRLEKLFIVRLT